MSTLSFQFNGDAVKLNNLENDKTFPEKSKLLVVRNIDVNKQWQGY